jgi:hypothetical protein
VLGQRTAIGEAWGAARGRLLRLLGLTLLNGVISMVPIALPVSLGVLMGMLVSPEFGVFVGLVAGIPGLAVFLLVQVRLVYLAPAALMLERGRVLAALRRSWALSRDQFWRLFGIVLLTGLIVGLVSQVIGIPFGVAGALFAFVGPGGPWVALLIVVSSYLSTIVAGAVATPFSAGVSTLLYVDQRIRKEAYDVELVAAAQPRAS